MPDDTKKLVFKGKKTQDIIDGPNGGRIVWAVEILPDGTLTVFCDEEFNRYEFLNDVAIAAQLMCKRVTQ